MRKLYATVGILGVALTSIFLTSSLGSLADNQTTPVSLANTPSPVLPPHTLPNISGPHKAEGGCEAFNPVGDSSAQDFSPQASARGEALRVLDRFADTPRDVATPSMFERARFAIALVPDPWHSNLGLLFDRDVDSLQEAARDSGYDYDSEWLPWKATEHYQRLDDEKTQDEIERYRSACPGFLLFRRVPTISAGHASRLNDRPYEDALLVFLVAERPTDGINLAEWRSAMTFISATGAKSTQELRVVGPEFSGSIPSLERALALTPALGVKSAVILSPSISTRSAVTEFRRWQNEQESANNIRTRFGTFGEPDEVQVSNLIKYLRTKHHARCTAIAVLSEGETSYGRMLSDVVGAGQDECKGDSDEMLFLSFPRDISDLRVAYQKASIFASLIPRDRPLRAILPSDAGLAAHGELDSVPEFADDLSAVEKEAWLYSAERIFKYHGTKYLILRTTNPLDALFLSRFFHRVQPEAHVVVVGADMLFPREGGTSELLGDMALAIHPMMPADAHWSSHNDANHAVLPGRVAAGEYFASRFLFGQERIDGLEGSNTIPELDQAQLLPQGEQANPQALLLHQLPPYSCPVWDTAACRNTMSPPLWLEVLGRDGYLPVKLFDFGLKPPIDDRGIPIKLETKPKSEHSAYFVPPGSIKTAICLSLLLVLYQLYGLLTVCPSTSIAWSFVFHNNYRLAGQEFLRAISSFLALLPLLEITTLRIAVFSVMREHWGQITILFLGDVLAAGLLLLFMMQAGGIERPIAKDHFDFDPRLRRRARRRAGKCFVILVVSWIVAVGVYLYCHELADLYPLLYRMEHLLSGVSPLLPTLFLTVSLYAWVWFCMAGNLMLGPGRPELPFGDDPFGSYSPHVWRKSWMERKLDEIDTGARGWFTTRTTALSKFALEDFRWRFLEPRDHFKIVGVVFRPPKFQLLPFEYRRLSRKIQLNIYRIAHPLFFGNLTMLSLLGVFALWFNWNFRQYWGSFAIEGNFFNHCLMALSCAMSLLVLLEAYRLYATYSQLRRVLLALGRSRLKEAIRRLPRLPYVSLWAASTNVHRVQYRLFQQQRDALDKLMISPGIPESGFRLDSGDKILKKSWETAKLIAEYTRAELERGMAVYWWMPVKKDSWCWESWPNPQDAAVPFRAILRSYEPAEPKRTIRELFRDATGHLFLRLIAEWNGPIPDAGPAPTADRIAAENFVALHYLSFVHIVVARLRTIAMTMVALFVGLSFAFSSYPFVPHQNIRLMLVLLFFIIAFVVGQVYVAMDRDEVMSMLTGGQPGKVGVEFWLKYASFLIGPLAGILAAQNPTLVDFILNWLQPGSALIR